MVLYKIRRNKAGTSKNTGEDYIACSLTVPNVIADQIKPDVLLEPELTEKGIFYKFVQKKDIEIPEWAKNE